MSESKNLRQERLLKEFEFLCTCEACSQNYFSPPAMKDPKLLKFAKKLNEDILKIQRGAVMKSFRNCCDSLEKFNENFPSLELCFLQKVLVTCCVRLAQPAVVF